MKHAICPARLSPFTQDRHALSTGTPRCKGLYNNQGRQAQAAPK